MPEVTIISQEEIPYYPSPTETRLNVAVTYTYGDLPPRTVWIDKEKLTDEVLRQAIREDLDKVKDEAPRTLTI